MKSGRNNMNKMKNIKHINIPPSRILDVKYIKLTIINY